MTSAEIKQFFLGDNAKEFKGNKKRYKFGTKVIHEPANCGECYFSRNSYCVYVERVIPKTVAIKADFKMCMVQKFIIEEVRV
jgi:hypothetical protein